MDSTLRRITWNLNQIIFGYKTMEWTIRNVTPNDIVSSKQSDISTIFADVVNKPWHVLLSLLRW